VSGPGMVKKLKSEFGLSLKLGLLVSMTVMPSTLKLYV